MGRSRLLGRFELLNWLNRTLSTDYLRLEDCADGVSYAQLLEALHPGTVPLHKLNFNARREDERQRNIALLTAGLHRANITCPLDLRKLAKGLFVDHNEFLQWLLGYIEADKMKAIMTTQGSTPIRYVGKS